MNDSNTMQVETDLIATLGPMGRRQKLTILALLVVALWGWAAYAYQVRNGLAVTAMNDYFSWGIYIINFVFFIGISMAGTLISAMLRLSGAHWRGPITRLAEAITLFSLLIAGPMVIIDMGRPERFYMILLHGRLQSPILWDVLSLTTYMAGSLLYLYLPLIPDMGILRDYPGPLPGWRRKLYTRLSLGWTGTETQRRFLDRAIFVMAIVILPVAVSIHTVTAWLFGMTLRPGWHTTIIGPDFVVGALYSGVAAVITVIALFRKFFRLERYLTADHFAKLANLLMVFGFIYAYFIVNEHVGSIYTNEGPEQRLDRSMFGGTYTYQFWGMVLIGLALPLAMLCIPKLRTAAGIVTASILVNIGMWLKRYVIVVPTLAAPFMPVVGGKPLSYVPTWVEWSITVGAFAGLSLMYVVFARVFPIISIWEMHESHRAEATAPSPRRTVPAGLMAGLIVAGAVAFLSGSAQAADTQPATQASTQPTAQIALAVVTEDKEQLVRATVTINGKPVENASVQFFAGRSFGNLKLGEDKTLDDGTAAVKFPVGLPGGPTGELNLIAEVTAPPNYAGAYAAITVSVGVPARPTPEPFPRALWAPHAPVILLVVIASLFGGVWITYAYVTWRLLALRKGATP
jgi:molybdopterin-containing oxidoreductase family membrane subunit